MELAFGPVPSRRLGRSLGVNNIPDKVCTYACVYCQIGNTLSMEIERRKFYEPEEIRDAVAEKITRGVDYITFVPDGEPTLDANLGRTAELLREFGVKLAIITNSSLLYREDVRNELMRFDYVSLKLDAVSEMLWRFVDRPHKSLSLDSILAGMLDFASEFKGTLVTETMLIDGVDYEVEIKKLAEFLGELKPEVAYIGVPTRPPAEKWVKPADEYTVSMAYEEFSRITRVEYLTGFEGTEFSSTGNFEEDLMSITAVHPMREDAVFELMRRCGATEEDLQELIDDGKLIVGEYEGHRYYMRALPSRRWMQNNQDIEVK
uniref:Fe-S oxidoreductase n=1 Tax=uncultured euryarchaeote Alv-FOS1 TaxID=337892 RepID=Q3SAC2_9EURY|nr:Fe-S oxidoreductase [uncultured euryarchaeote Alv-FOS1]